jgi:hypothetical protein
VSINEFLQEGERSTVSSTLGLVAGLAYQRLLLPPSVSVFRRFGRRWAMAKIIEFYVPKDFRKKTNAAEKRGELIEFRLPKKSA